MSEWFDEESWAVVPLVSSSTYQTKSGAGVETEPSPPLLPLLPPESKAPVEPSIVNVPLLLPSDPESHAAIITTTIADAPKTRLRTRFLILTF